uniref:Actin n=1 Tax=Phaeomonas parva TaxID=124430 RepID=A0A7S1U4R7_9STRA|mmetsp:Transcript_31559/g.100153  ORF Transcript_31559/g.100153 Transcript_31559/m.100153 type:complete len:369 (+) Transcript_31559:347-1453(+)|eukprot:CAMPEP_0118853222 /NCGR_PEP_ID=MMETSP1163-20130328/1890_1 /TAXON_ID=124430 /ORGANISM="Phaeomonas parva, Strain CCMP2877" /LENGTH=368 /DNA_ID=CAMNT_0006785735 /DNA_START=188 /DNA_END=1294 /DNA_ORIENTATION=-
MEEYAVVLDAGTTSIKAGYSGEDSPRAVIHGSLEMSNDQRITGIVERSVIADMGKFQEAIEDILENELIISSKASKESTTVGVCMTMPLHAERAQREELAQILFEQVDAPSVCFANSSVMSLFASGRTTGMVLEVGGGTTQSVPVFEGFALKHASITNLCAGMDVTRVFQNSLAASGRQLDFRVCADIKESMCYIEPDPAFKTSTAKSVYELPDGTILELPPSKCHMPGEVLFNPNIHGARTSPLGDMRSEGGVHELAARSIEMCDAELRDALAANIVLAGGATMMKGFCERAARELAGAIKDAGGAQGVQVYPDGQGMQRSRGYNAQRRFAAWTGASMFASLPTYADITISKAEWEDNQDIVHRKLI